MYFVFFSNPVSVNIARKYLVFNSIRGCDHAAFFFPLSRIKFSALKVVYRVNGTWLASFHKLYLPIFYYWQINVTLCYDLRHNLLRVFNNAFYRDRFWILKILKLSFEHNLFTGSYVFCYFASLSIFYSLILLLLWGFLFLCLG